MITPLIMLALLTLPWAIATAARTSREQRRSAARLGLALVFIFTGIGHFLTPGPMAEMIPPVVPFRLAIIYISGVFELALAAALLWKTTSRFAGLVAIAMLIGFLPFNIYAAINRVPMGGHEWGPVYLLIRIPLQIVLVWWAWWFLVRGNKRT